MCLSDCQSQLGSRGDSSTAHASHHLPEGCIDQDTRWRDLHGGVKEIRIHYTDSNTTTIPFSSPSSYFPSPLADMAWDCTRPLHRRKSPLFFLATVVAVVCCCWYGVNFNTHVIPTPSPWQPKIDLQTSNGSQSRGDRTTKYDMNHRLSSHTNYTAYTYLKTVKNKETNVGVEEKSLFEKVSYQLLKSVMQSLLTSHLRRKEKMKLMNSYPRGREGRGDLLTRDINYLSDQSAGRVSDESESAPTTSLKSTNNATKQSSTSTRPKKILFYGGFYGSKKQWKRMLRNMNLRDCPERKCVFTTKDSEASTADAVVFHYIEFALSDLPKVRLPHQRYVWLNTESSERLTQANQGRLRHSHWSDAGVFNWTMTYHRSSDIYMPYGSLFSLRVNPIDPTSQPNRPNQSTQSTQPVNPIDPTSQPNRPNQSTQSTQPVNPIDPTSQPNRPNQSTQSTQQVNPIE
ncbi:hypothetical protein Pcinc_004760 [Petrolisthes cinctipes]|uniref:Fucosyltransferase N-terminal domain-containing protein n=1 Tax=Petrolisthes cinctipes TaxID=88211 RepID=A0AAE1GGC5_PETCI|nr:hypothetical protein Pcinc_004760 [Petrolisthes cinctipes]